MRRWLLMSCCLLLVGCGQQQEKYEISADQPEIVQKIKQLLDAQEEVEHANILLVENQLIVALQVKPWQRFKKSSIEDKLQKKVDKQFP